LKRALLTGTKPHSLGRYIGESLRKQGWDVWLYSRSASYEEAPNWHLRTCDITNTKEIEKLLKEIPTLDLAVQLADPGGPFGSLEELSEKTIKDFIGVKLIGNILLTQALLKKARKSNHPLQLVWGAGKPSVKPKHLILFSPVNSALAVLVDELNRHYAEIASAYYLLINLISPSTQGDLYIEKFGHKEQTDPPSMVIEHIETIIHKKVLPGLVNLAKRDVL
jgi:NAD(P)-dependent dehydrogenase (short-subunit alcohol dehydrogenase family)